MTSREGIIKYRCSWNRAPVDQLTLSEIENLNHWRGRLREQGVIGIDKFDTGFGNISFRASGTSAEQQMSEDGSENHATRFVITGSQTGHIEQLAEEHLALVTRFSLADNFVECTGLSRASSESLTHAVIYQTAALCNAVIHIHSISIWEKARDAYPVTDPRAEYGTPELASAIEDLIVKDPHGLAEASGIIILGGHPEGIIIFDSSLKKAGIATLKLIEKYAARSIIDQS